MILTLVLNQFFLPLHLHTLSVCILIGVLLCIASTDELFFNEWFQGNVTFKSKWPFLMLVVLAISCGGSRKEDVAPETALVHVGATPEGCKIYRLKDPGYNSPVIVICNSGFNPAVAQH